MSLNRPQVYVVGAGMVGLSAAINIQEALPEAQVTIIADKFCPNRALTSFGSSGGWGTCIAVLEQQNKKIEKWSRSTWHHFFNIVQSPEASVAGVQFVPGYVLYYKKQKPQNPWWRDLVLGYHQVSESEIEKMFPDFKDGVSFSTITADCERYLPFLMDRFTRAGGRVVNRKLKSLGELVGKADIVVNCTGLGARFLVGDKNMRPMRGHLIKIDAPWQHFFIHDQPEEQREQRVYFLPRRNDVMLGVTQQIDRWDTEVDPKDTKHILESCYRAAPSLRAAKILDHWVGLRPYRNGGPRLEKETMQFDNGSLQVIHNYGHGSGGVTWHWGCAEEATKLVRECLQAQRPTASNHVRSIMAVPTLMSKI